MNTRLATATTIVVAVAVNAPSPAVAIDDEIKVLLLVPRGHTIVAVQTARLERAIAEAGGAIVVVPSLREAAVVVEFSDYRRVTGEDGEPVRKWFGHVVPLVPSDEAALSHAPAAGPFVLAIVGEDGTEDERTVQAFEMALRKAFGGWTSRGSVDTI